ncbi:MAG: esterase [Chloroflexi bacterium]|nr:esterase [Chloroflexota bacterium]
MKTICFLWLGLLLLTGCAGLQSSRQGIIQTTDGPVSGEQIGLILPHEHIFTDLRGPETPGYGQADAEEVIRVMKPLLQEAKAAGADLLVECTGVGVGRNAPLLARLAKESGLRIVVPTGVYGRAHYAPQAYRQMSAQELTAWMVKEIRDGIEGTRIKAGFIKIAASDDELKPLEEKFLRAAARAALQTGVAIASHTIAGPVAERQADILAQEGLSLDRFVWVHAQAERDLSFHRRLARRGVYIELDSIGATPQEDARWISMIHNLIADGHGDRVLLSHDAGWFNPGQPGGGQQRPYTYLLKTFLPKLQASGFGEAAIQQLTVLNPRRAFTIKGPSQHRAVQRP